MSEAIDTTRTTAFAEPVVISQFWKNRGKTQALVVRLCEYEAYPYCDVRLSTDPTGKLLPTKKGVSCGIKYLPTLVNALTAAVRKATELGLINGEGR